jgi:adenylate cyclase
MTEWHSFPAPAARAENVQEPEETYRATAIHRQLERICGSAAFRGSLRLTRFLRFVVETTLAGQSDRIKAYTIAVEALGRAADFDPQSDPIVRVEAGRLRQALARYYAEFAADDLVTIELPRGTYVPSFRCRTSNASRRMEERSRSRHPDCTMPAESANESISKQQFGRNAANLPGRIQQFGVGAAACYDMAAPHHRQITSLTDILESALRTLQESRNLLQASASSDLATNVASLQTPDRTRGAGSTDWQPSAGENAEEASSSRVFQWAERPAPRHEPQIAAVRNRLRLAASAIIAWPHGKARILRTVFGVAAAFALLLALLDIEQHFTGHGNAGSLFELWRTPNANAAQPASVAGEPIIYVEPVRAVGEPQPDASAPWIIRERLFDALARYDEVTVVPDAPHGAAESTAASQSTSKPSPPYYRLSTGVNYYPDGTFTIPIRLIDTADGTIVWTKAYDREPEHIRHKGAISRDVAQTLLQQFGVIQAREVIKRANADPMRDSYRCILDANTYLRSFAPAFYWPARSCLEHAATGKRPSVGIFVKLSRLYLRDYELGGVDGPPGDHGKLERAYRTAARAIEIKPNSAEAQFAMGQAQLARGDFELAKTAEENALLLNPNDDAVIFGRAALLILTGQIDDGLLALRQHTTATSMSWKGHHFMMALGSYLRDDLATADMEVGQVADKDFAPGLMLDAIIAGKKKNRLRTQRDIELLYARYPSWQHNARVNIGYFLPDHDMADRISNDFAAVAGNSVLSESQ